MSELSRARFTSEERETLRRSIADLRRGLDQRFGERNGHEPDPAKERPGGSPFVLADRISGQLRTQLDWLDKNPLYQALRGLALTLGGGGASTDVDEFGFDSAYLEGVRPLLDFLFERWWRVEVTGAEGLRREGPVIFVSNRSGILPYDALMLAHAAERFDPERRRPRFLVADWLVSMPFSQPLLTRLGGIRACPQNAERLLRAGHSIVVFPEGKKGALKPFRERYRLQRFARGGFVSLALRMNATLVPVAVVGAEETHPVLFRPQLPGRLLGVPVPVTPTFPLLGPFGLLPLPSRWRIRFGTPIAPDSAALARADDALFVNRMRERIRNEIQNLLDEEVRRRSGVFSA